MKRAPRTSPGARCAHRALLVLLLAALAWPSPARADSERRPFDHLTADRTGQFAAVLLATGFFVTRDVALRARYRRSGVYRLDGSHALLYPLDGWASQVEVSSDGQSVVRYGRWPARGHFEELALEFLHQGRRVSAYQVDELASRLDQLPASVSHYHWRAFSRIEQGGRLHLRTLDGLAYWFDVRTGHVEEALALDHETLVDELEDADPEIRQAAAEVLSHIEPSHDPAIGRRIGRSLISLCEHNTDHDHYAIPLLGGVLRAMGSAGCSEAGPIIRVAQRASALGKRSTLFALAGDFLECPVLASEDAGAKADAASALHALRAVLGDPDPDCRRQALGLLSRLHAGAAALSAPLAEQLSHADPALRRTAARALEILASRFSPGIRDQVLDALGDPDAEVRRACLASLRATANAGDLPAARLRHLAADPSPAIRRELAGFLGSPGIEHAARESLLLQLLEDTEVGVLDVALRTLRRAGPAAASPALVTRVIDILRRVRPPLRDTAERVLCEAGDAALAAQSALAALLISATVAHRRAAVTILGALSAVPEDLVVPLHRCLEDPDDTVRRLTARALSS